MRSRKCLQAVLRMEGANIMPFTANNLAIFVSALVASLPNVTASDIVIGQVQIRCTRHFCSLARAEKSSQKWLDFLIAVG